jgi:hypothetical protein
MSTKSETPKKSLKSYLSKLKVPLFLIIVILFLIGITSTKNETNPTETYLNTPEIGDLYLIRNSYPEDTSYYFLRLGAINSTKDSFSFYLNQNFYSQRPSELSEDDYFVRQERRISAQYLDTLFKENKILSIQRSSDISASFNKIKEVDTKLTHTTSDTFSKVWQTLLSLKFDIYFDKKLDDVFFKPMYTEDIKKLDGTTITLKAFMYAEGASNTSILLSAYRVNPRNTCVSTSVESMIEIPNTPGLVFKACKSCVVRGELSLNTDDYLKVPYSLKNIEFIRCEDLESGE